MAPTRDATVAEIGAREVVARPDVVVARPPTGAQVRARAQRDPVRTLLDMPRSRPPRTTKSGSLRAAGTYPVRPVRPSSDTVPAAAGPTDSPLVGLRRPVAATATPVVVMRRLDRGRLYAPAIIDAVGWPCPARLDADVSRPERVLLRPAPEIAGVARSTSRPHLDQSGRIVLPIGIRAHLGIDPNAEIVVIARDGFVEIVTLGRMLTGLDTLGALDTLRATPAGPVAADAHTA